jgi:DNA-binding NarL/FixJ family response regulator
LKWPRATAKEWTVLDEFVTNGTRFVVAYQNEPAPASQLSARERQVLTLSCAGESNKAIGYRLGISASTVGVLLWRASSKLGVSTRGDLLRKLLGNGT